MHTFNLGDQMLTEFHFDSKSVMSRISHSTFSITVSNNHLLLLHFARSEGKFSKKTPMIKSLLLL